jgi:hypothetical protein
MQFNLLTHFTVFFIALFGKCVPVFTVDVIKMLIHHTSADFVEEELWVAQSQL